MAKLVITLNGVNIREFELPDGPVTIGRRASNDIPLSDMTVSSTHARIEANEVKDLGSTNGTRLNGQRIANAPLRHGDVIGIGQHEMTYVDPAAGFESTVIIAPAEADESSAAPARLLVMTGPKAGECLRLEKSHTTLGKPGVQVAVIARRGPDYVLLPLSAGDGAAPARVNGENIGASSVPLRHGDTIEVAGARVQFLNRENA
jgi:pSer/pThr/pTyr-binding forkhead associated (FHA) protein